MYTETTPILRDSHRKRNNNEVEPFVVRAVSYRRLILLLAGVGFLGCIAVFGVVSFNPTHSAGDHQVSASAPETRQNSAAGLTVQNIHDLAKSVGSPRLPESSLRRLEEDGQICTSKGCLEAASSLLRSMNFSVQPCEDFYQFTCGQWIADNKIPESQSRWNQFNILRDRVNSVTKEILSSPKDPADALPINQVKDFYKLCTDTDRLETVGLSSLHAILEGYGDWPLLLPEGESTSTNFDWVQVVADTTRRFQSGALISVNVDQDWKNTDANIVFIDQPTLVLPRTMLVDETHTYDDILAGYMTYITEVGTLLVQYWNDGSGLNAQAMQAYAKEIVEFEQRLAKVTSKDEDRTNNDRMYNKRTLSEYQSETGVIGGEYEELDWKRLLDSVFSSSGITIESNEPLIVTELNYFKELTTLLQETSKRIVANYVLFRLVDGLLDDTTQEMRDIKFKSNQLLTGAQMPKSRAETCADAANSALGMAIGVKYVEKEFDETAKATVNEMVEDLRFGYNEILKSLADSGGWMDATTSKKAQEKLAVMKPFMAYPDWLGNRTRIEDFYHGLIVGDTDHLANVESILTWSSDDTLKKLRKPVNREFWLAYPGIVNAFYSPTHNSITFPAGILQPPFFKEGFPGFLNYGAIGAVIGHEMTHGFDNNGRQFDEHGNLRNWWTNSTLQKFQDKTKCIVNQYGAFKPKEVDLFVNGNLTQGENIADNGGVHEAYLAYQRRVSAGMVDKRLPGLEQFDPEQLFFMGFSRIWCENITPQALENQMLTDPHSPTRFRVQGPLSNSAPFSEKWKCAAGSPMNPNPSGQCVLW